MRNRSIQKWAKGKKRFGTLIIVEAGVGYIMYTLVYVQKFL